MDTNKLLALIIQVGSFVSTFAAIAAGIIMSNVTKKFGTGMLSIGFKSVAIGIICLAAGILTDALGTYVTAFNNLGLSAIILTFKELLFVVGTYSIVIGSKKIADKLESLTKL